jgi:hypothetical protein
MTIGKNAMKNAISTFGSKPKPNHTTKMGANATFGIAWLATRKRIEDPLERGKIHNEDAERYADGDAEAEATRRFKKRDETVFDQALPLVNHDHGDVSGRRQRVGRDMEYDRRSLPEDEQENECCGRWKRALQPIGDRRTRTGARHY